MKDYIKRMLDEKRELAERINKANKYLEEHGDKNNGWPTELRLLSAQVSAMETYYTILSLRIWDAGEREGMQFTQTMDMYETGRPD